MKKIEDNSCSLLSHFWTTSRSPVSTCYIPFQSSGSQKSNTLNGAQFGVETKKLQPLQVNHSKLKKAFCKSVAESPFCCEMISQPFCTVLWNSSWSFPIFPDTLEAEHRKLKDHFAANGWFRNLESIFARWAPSSQVAKSLSQVGLLYDCAAVFHFHFTR